MKLLLLFILYGLIDSSLKGTDTKLNAIILSVDSMTGYSSKNASQSAHSARFPLVSCMFDIWIRNEESY